MCTGTRVDNFAVDSSVLLNVRHLPDTGYCVYCVGQSVACLVAAAGTVYKAMKNSQIMILKKFCYINQFFFFF